jgi:hypothetical protein
MISSWPAVSNIHGRSPVILPAYWVNIGSRVYDKILYIADESDKLLNILETIWAGKKFHVTLINALEANSLNSIRMEHVECM